MPPWSPACPRCASTHVTPGTFRGEGRWAVAFRPAGLRFWTFKAKEVVLPPSSFGEPNAWACMTCGLAWAEVDAEKLREKIDEVGKEETRARFAEALAPELAVGKR
jgi:hypothetical protein